MAGAMNVFAEAEEEATKDLEALVNSPDPDDTPDLNDEEVENVGDVEDDVEEGDEEESDETDSAEEEATEEDESAKQTPLEIEIDGEKVSLDELKAGYLRQSDYTRKTQEIANKRHETEAWVQEQLNLLNEERTRHKDILEAADFIRSNPGLAQEINALVEDFVRNTSDANTFPASAPRINDPTLNTIQTLESRLAALEKEKQEQKSMDAEKQYEVAIEDMAKTYPFYSREEVDGLILSGKAKSVEEAMQTSHRNQEAIRQAAIKEYVKKKAASSKKGIGITRGSKAGKKAAPKKTDDLPMNSPEFLAQVAEDIRAMRR